MGIPIGADVIRMKAGALALLPGLGLAFAETELDPSARPPTAALVEIGTCVFRFAFWIAYAESRSVSSFGLRNFSSVAKILGRSAGSNHCASRTPRHQVR